MKKIANYVALVLLFLILVACEKKGSSVEVQGNGAEVISEVVDVMPQADVEQANIAQKLQNTANSNALKIVETVVPPYTELKVGPLSRVGYCNDFGYNFMRDILRYDSLAFEVIPFDNNSDNYLDYEAKFIDTIEQYGAVVTSTDRENKTINGNQSFSLPSGKEVVYEFQYQLLQLPYDELNQYSEFSIIYYRLLNQDDFITQSTMYTKQPYVQVSESLSGDEFEKLANIFETHINERTDFDKLGDFIVYSGLHINEEQKAYNEQVAKNKYQTKRIVKSNFINSGYNEYLVFFNRGKTFDDLSSELDEFIDVVDCFIVKDNVVLQSYRIDAVSGYLDNYSLDDNFASKFSQGYIGDFNKNGINEIIFLCEYGFSYDVFTVEFSEDHFETSLMPIGRSDFIYDWLHECFTCKYNGIGNYIGSTPFDYNQKIGWSDSQRCYLLISDEIDKTKKTTKKLH